MSSSTGVTAPGRVWRAVLGVALALTLVALGALAWRSRPAAPSTGEPAGESATSALTLAVIGDVPSTTFQLKNFPKLVNQIGNSRATFVAHLGDFKDDKSPCSDAYYGQIRDLFESFTDPVLYTPGHLDWATCHKRQNGGTSPLNRLGGLRNFFFSTPNTGLAQRSERFHDYAPEGYPENVRFAIAGTSFAAIHVLGSENGLEPWTGQSRVNREQRDEVEARTQSAVRVLQDTFASASGQGDRSVVIFTQADMFPPDERQRTRGFADAYRPVVSALAAEAAAFPGEVYLLNSGTGVYRADRPLSAKSTWRKFYGVSSPVNRLRRVTVDGGTQATNYLRLTIDYRKADPVSWVRVPVKG